MNARSLCPKINSLIDCFGEMNVTIATITETWLADGEGLEEDVDDLLLGAGIGMIYKNRPVNDRGVAHGGVAICYRESAMSLKEVKTNNPGKYEVIMAAGTMVGFSRKMVVISCYLPPNYKTARARRAMDYISGCVTKAKRLFSDPFIIIAGDFNQ